MRATLEKVRKKMYGEYDEMKRKIQQLTNELKVSIHSFVGKAYENNCPSVIQKRGFFFSSAEQK